VLCDRPGRQLARAPILVPIASAQSTTGDLRLAAPDGHRPDILREARVACRRHIQPESWSTVEVPVRSIAGIHNSKGEHHVKLSTGGRSSTITIPPKPTGLGSSVTGGEMLMLALATCYCNDIYREAAKRGIDVTHVDVECGAEFPAEGEPARDMTYTARITAKASDQQIRDLAAQADRLAEIQNTVRAATPVILTRVEVEVV